MLTNLKVFFMACEGLTNRFLTFIRVVDEHDGNISLTNLMVYGAIYAIANGGGNGIGEVTGILAAIANYTAKKVINKDKTNKLDEVSASLEKIGADVANITSRTEKIEELDGKIENLKTKVSFEQLQRKK